MKRWRTSLYAYVGEAKIDIRALLYNDSFLHICLSRAAHRGIVPKPSDFLLQTLTKINLLTAGTSCYAKIY